MSRRIVKKILPEYFDLISLGKKKYEFRLADFEAEDGDVLVLEEWDSVDPATRKSTGRVIEKTITYARKFRIDELNQLQDMKEHGFYILQFD